MKKLFWLLPLSLILLATLASARDYSPKFVGYDVAKPQAALRASCEATPGRWTTYYKMGDNSIVINSATCVYKKQLVSENETVDLIRPAEVNFVFDKSNSLIETGTFLWRFNSWARREDVKNHFIVKLQDARHMYPLNAIAMKVGVDSYRLENTPFYLRLLAEDEEEIEVPEYLLYVTFVRGTP